MTTSRNLSVLLLSLFLLTCCADAAGTRAASDRQLGYGNGNGNSNGNGNNVVRIPSGMAVIPSTKSFDDTYNDLTALLEANPNIKIIKEIDHSAAAASVGLDLPPNKVVFFGNPALGSPIMLQDQRAGLDLPQKMLVWEDTSDGQVYLGYNSVDYLEVRHEAIEGTPQLDTVEGALANFAAGATGVAVEDILEEATMTPKEQAKLKKQSTLRTAKSDFDFATTLQRLIAAIEASPASIALELDHSANAAKVPLDLRPTTLLVFGNPNLGTPLMQAGPSVGIDLPLKMLVWENESGTVFVTTNAPYFLRERHGLEGVGAQIDAARGAILNFLDAATTDDR